MILDNFNKLNRECQTYTPSGGGAAPDLGQIIIIDLLEDPNITKS